MIKETPETKAEHPIATPVRKSAEAVLKNKIEARATELKTSIPKSKLPSIIDDLKRYVEIRQMYNPEDPHAMDDYIDAMSSFEPWEIMTDIYGHTPNQEDPKWTIVELEKLIDLLQN